jgi:hypothetical protein
VVVVVVALAGVHAIDVDGASAAVGGPPPLSELQRNQQGKQVLAQHPDLVPEIAKRSDVSVAEARGILRDPTAWVSNDGAIYFVDRVPDGMAAAPASVPPAGPFPYSQTFLLHSRPGSNRTIYLDFNGHTVSGTTWNTAALPTITATPYNRDGVAGFSNAEQDDIQNIWQRVAEDFSPFAVDVTTQDPGTAAIDRSSATDTIYGTRVVITDSSWYGATPEDRASATGVAQLGNFDSFGAGTLSHAYKQPAWAFPRGLTYNAKRVADVVTHEAGHTLGLNHDGVPPCDLINNFNAPECYYRGHGAWAPIMGAAYAEPIGHWDQGEFPNAINTQDDLSEIAANGAPFRTDEHTNARSTATPLGVSSSGVITPGDNADLFRYTATVSGPVTFRAVPAPNGPNLDIALRLYSDASIQLAVDNPVSAQVDEATASGLSASITYSVTAGVTYYLQVAPTGYLTPLTGGYSSYGSLGQYTVSPSVASNSSRPHDLTSDGPNDLLARNTAGQLFIRPGSGTGGLLPARQIASGGFDFFDAILVTHDFSGDGIADFFARAAQSGELYLYRGLSNGTFDTPIKVGSTAWAGFTAIVAPGDFDGDGKADVIGRKADGTLWLYPGNGASGWKQPFKQIGASWETFTAVVAPGDFDGDGKADLIARKAEGTLWLYPGNGASGWKQPFKQIAVGWQSYTAVVAPGDFDGDGKADLIGRKADGTLWLYPGNGATGWKTPFKQLEAGWNVMNIIS